MQCTSCRGEEARLAFWRGTLNWGSKVFASVQAETTPQTNDNLFFQQTGRRSSPPRCLAYIHTSTVLTKKFGELRPPRNLPKHLQKTWWYFFLKMTAFNLIPTLLSVHGYKRSSDSACLEPPDQNSIKPTHTQPQSNYIRPVLPSLPRHHKAFIFLCKCEPKLVFNLQDVVTRVREEMKRQFWPWLSRETSRTWILCWRQIRLASDLSAMGIYTHTHILLTTSRKLRLIFCFSLCRPLQQ